MTRVVIQPSYGNRDAWRHWADTLDQEVPFTTAPRQLALTTADMAALMDFHPGGSARFWGATGNHDARMATLEEGDVILFTGKKIVRAIGEVGYSFRNSAFANTLWDPHEERGSYQNVYSLIAFQRTEIPYEEIWDLPGFNPGDNFMGLRFLDQAKSDTILQGLAIDTLTAAAQQVTQESRLTAALSGETAQFLDVEAVNTTHTSYTRPAGITLVHRAEALLVSRYRSELAPDETARRISTRAGITDLYVTGPAGPEIIEAKRAAGHQFVRQALGQLLDYVIHAPEPVTRLSALFPAPPSPADIALLNRYGIDCIHQAPDGAFIRDAATDDQRQRMKAVWG
ncbi:hypothetical protein AB0F81_23230 [Actinoplanes sp. NPDC024001]|uniref:hypothetical protein n=1 Tax=Actinoplanes sp. NPDC024001 TaxID=3154598 RepID=UPI00340172FB